MAYTPPAGHQLKFNFLGADNYAPPGATAVAFNFTGYPPYVPPAGNRVPLEFGEAYSPPTGSQVALEFVRGDIPAGDVQYLFPTGSSMLDLGTPGVRNQWAFVVPPGIAGFASGQALVWLYHRRLTPSGIPAPGIGTPSVILKDRPVYPVGFNALAAGNPTIINRNRYVFAGNISAPIWGGPTVWLYTRFLVPTGLLATAIANTNRVSHERQFAQLNAGIAPPPMGTAWVSHGTRAVEPVGYFQNAVGWPLVGGTRYLAPPGWDSQAFGTRIIPESQTIAPLGFRELWGEQRIYNHRTIAAPHGFESNGQEEFRWGRADVWNLRQYITQFYDPDSELNPPPWSQWTLVANRNRVIAAIGVTPPPAGFPQIDNNARVLQPGGINYPGYPGTEKTTMVAYGVRHLPLEGIEPPPMLTWHAVYNDARVLWPTGSAQSAFGVATLENTRRYFDRIGGFDAAEIGTAFIAFAIRDISIEPRYSIAPPDIPLPEVKLHSRYVDPIGGDMLGAGLPALTIHFNIIAPKWAHQDLFGEPRAYNVTPEVRAYGANAEEFGDAFVRLQWRPAAPNGNNMQLFGLSRIADKTQSITVAGTNMLRIGDKLTVIKTGAPPYSQQNIVMNGAVSDGASFGTPGLNQFVIRPIGIPPPQFGLPAARIMGASVIGIKVDGYGEPMVSLKNRMLTVAEWPNALVYQPSAPSLSPHTIWAVKEAPQQAIQNHPPRSLHYVGEVLGAGGYPPGERFGSHRISTYLGILRPSSLGNTAAYGVPSVYLKRRYVAPTGIQAYRMGWAVVGDGTQFVTQFGGGSFMLFGSPSVARGPYLGPQTISPQGIASPGPGPSTWVSLLHRTFSLTGFNALAMGSSRGDSPYQWQTLHVGPPMPTIPIGFNAERFGTTWVSLRVRGVEPEGWESFISEYDPAHFAGRLRVRNAYVPLGPPARTVTPVGIDREDCGVPNVRPGVHYIRPDGNADQYRKGAF